MLSDGRGAVRRECAWRKSEQHHVGGVRQVVVIGDRGSVPTSRVQATGQWRLGRGRPWTRPDHAGGGSHPQHLGPVPAADPHPAPAQLPGRRPRHGHRTRRPGRVLVRPAATARGAARGGCAARPSARPALRPRCRPRPAAQRGAAPRPAAPPRLTNRSGRSARPRDLLPLPLDLRHDGKRGLEPSAGDVWRSRFRLATSRPTSSLCHAKSGMRGRPEVVRAIEERVVACPATARCGITKRSLGPCSRQRRRSARRTRAPGITCVGGMSSRWSSLIGRVSSLPRGWTPESACFTSAAVTSAP